MELLDLCKKIISINSVTIPNGTREIIDFLLPLFKSLGLETSTQEFPIEGHPNFNLLITAGPKDKAKPFLINTHLDTVAPGTQKKWTVCGGNAFQATIKDGFLYGLGSADTKCAMACVWVALKSLIQDSALPKPQNWQVPLFIAGTAGEERGLLGSHHALKTNFFSAQMALDSEPTENHLVWSHKGLTHVTVQAFPKQGPVTFQPGKKHYHLEFQGEAAHSSTPHLGKNSILLALDFLHEFLADASHKSISLFIKSGTAPNVIPENAHLYLQADEDISFSKYSNHLFSQSLATEEELKKLEGYVFFPASVFHGIFKVVSTMHGIQKHFSLQKHSGYNPPHSSTTATLAKVLKRPKPHLEFLFDCRFVEEAEGKYFHQQLEEVVASLNQSNSDIEFSLQLERFNSAMRTPTHSAFVKTLQLIAHQVGISSELRTKTGCTEGGLFSQHGIQTVVFGPGRAENNIHKPNEKVSISDLENAVKFYREAIKTFCF